MSKKRKFTTKELLSKIEYEGGIGGALSYGIEADEIADEKLAELWKKVEGPFRELSDHIDGMMDDIEWDDSINGNYN